MWLDFRLYSSQQRAYSIKSNKITLIIQEINFQKGLCMQKNEFEFIVKFQVEKKFPTFS